MNSLVDARTSDKPAPNSLLLERSILKGDVSAARNCLRSIFLQMTELEAGATVGDALSQFSQAPLKHRMAAIFVLRSLGVQGLMPEANQANQIIRSTVQLCEGAVPDIVKFLKIDGRLQNIDKFNALTNCHARLSEILGPLQVPYGDLGALLSARKDILGSLNHSIIGQYCAPFLLKEVRSTIESIIGKLTRLSETTPSLLIDIEECNQAISSAKEEAAAAPTFLTN